MAKERTPLHEKTLRQLRKIASSYNISRYSRMRKAQLMAEIEKIEKEKYSPNSSIIEEEQKVEAAKFELGQEDILGGPLSSVDEGLGELPESYGESRIILMPRDPQWAYTYWDIPQEDKKSLPVQEGQQLALRLYDVTDIDLKYQSPHCVQEYLCDESAKEWYLPIPISDRDYAVDIGYRCTDGRWLVLARSAPVRIPPVYPSDWVEDTFVTLNWEEDLVGKTIYQLVPPTQKTVLEKTPISDQLFAKAQSTEAVRIAGSLFASMQHLPGSKVAQKPLSSYLLPSGIGMWTLPTVSGVNLSGVGLSGSITSRPPRKFWLVADAELIVYGATEPDARVSIGGRPVKLNPDGTFRVQISFQDGVIDYPIVAVSADGQQARSIEMKFSRETPSRNTNTKEEAMEESML